MHKFRYKLGTLIIAAAVMVTTMTGVTTTAAENETEVPGRALLPARKEGILSVDLPAVGEESPFDFYLDPQGLIYATGAARYGGGTVEAGTHLLFRNRERGEYDFSGRSDRLRVVNKSTVPVRVRITAKVEELGDFHMDLDGSFEGESDCAIYLAIVDDEGREQSLSEEGEVSLETVLSSAPPEAYTYRYEESTGSYQYAYKTNTEIAFDSYSFGLRGECNGNAGWGDVSVSPRVVVTWEIDPVYPDAGTEEQKNEPKEEETAGPENESKDVETAKPKNEPKEEEAAEPEKNPEEAKSEETESIPTETETED